MRAFTSSHLDRRLSPLVAAGAIALLVALVGMLAMREAGPADAAKAKELGKTNRTPGAACPNACTAIGSVTGFQTMADGKKQPFKARQDGHLVAWSLDLGKPDK